MTEDGDDRKFGHISSVRSNAYFIISCPVCGIFLAGSTCEQSFDMFVPFFRPPASFLLYFLLNEFNSLKIKKRFNKIFSFVESV